MFHGGVALLAFLVPAVLPCAHVGLRAGQPDDHLFHVHVIVNVRVFCARKSDDGKFPSTVSLELGNRASPKSYLKLNSTTYTGRPEGVHITLPGDYSYDPRANCIVGKPRLSVHGHCGDIEVYDLELIYATDQGDKKHHLEAFTADDIHPIGPF